MRYAKQELLEGWNQKNLKNSEIVVIGSNNLASFILIDLIAMGFGNIRRIGKSSFSFLNFYELNSDVEFEEIQGEILNEIIAKDYIGEPNFIIESSKSIHQKMICLNYAKKRGIPIISSACSNESYSIRVLESGTFLDNFILEDILNFHSREINSEDGITNAIVASGRIVDELRKRIMPLEKDKKFTKLYNYTKEEKINQKVLLVGAGAIGTFAGISLALNNAEVDVVDFDKVEESNLNRQILFYDSIGKYKSEIMAKKLSSIGKFKGIVGKVDESYKLEKDYGIILSCVDNLKARYHLDWIAYKTRTPLINSGTSIFSGSVMPYVHGKTACLDCQTFGGIGRLKDKKDNGSCYEPAIIISNQIIGGLQVNKISRIFKDSFNTIKYDSNNKIREIATLEKCCENCEKNE